MKHGHEIIDTWASVYLTRTRDGRYHALIPDDYGDFRIVVNVEGWATPEEAVSYLRDRTNWPLRPWKAPVIPMEGRQ